jgi:NAD(P)H-quinone oxidoreductase subunit L
MNDPIIAVGRDTTPRLSLPRASTVPLPGFLNSISTETLLVIGVYLALAGAYLVVVPLALYWWMNRRWTVMGKLERLGVYGLVFLFFPGLILFAPFLNLRLAGQGE